MRLVTCGALAILITACVVGEPPAPARVAPDEAVLESKGRPSVGGDLFDATDACVLSCTAVMALSCGAVVAACYGVSAITVGATVVPCGFACGAACGAASLGVAGCVHLCT